MKKNNFMKVLILLLVCSMLTACSSSKVTTTKKDDTDTAKVETNDSEDATVESEEESTTDAVAPEEAGTDQKYGLGDLISVSVDGQEKYMISIDGVTTTDERNEYADTNPAQVIVIDYSYWNVGCEEDIYISDYDFKVIDAEKNVCSSYPGTINYYPSNAPLGTKCSAQACFGLDKESENVELHFYDNLLSTSSDFIIDIPTNAVSEVAHDDAASYTAPKDCYKVGDTVTVSGDSGDFNITINSAKKIKERNEYASQEVGAVWIVDYTYENISVEEDIYVSDIDFIAVDKNGNVGSSYPGDYTKYPEDTPKGTKCTAELCFGTKTDTDTIYLYYYDNMFNEKADMIFEITEK